MWLFYYFYFEKTYEVLKSKGLCFLLNKNIDFYKNETKSENATPPPPASINYCEKFPTQTNFFKQYTYAAFLRSR